MNITEHEMRGLLTGKCIPGDIMVNEELPAYLVRKFAELKAQRDALAIENVAFKSAVESHKHGFVRCECCGEENMCHTDDVCRLLDETPATDAWMNSAQAESLEAFAHQQRVIADALPGHEAQRSHRITACRAEDFAKQLRAGEPS